MSRKTNRCASCGTAWQDHLGIEGTCRKLLESCSQVRLLRDLLDRCASEMAVHGYGEADYTRGRYLDDPDYETSLRYERKLRADVEDATAPGRGDALRAF